MQTEDEEIAEIVREVMEEEARERMIVPDGGSVRVPMYLRDGETMPQLRARTSDAYQIFLADRAEYFRLRDEELRQVAMGIETPSYVAACEARDAAWQKRGEQQTAAWQQRPSAQVNVDDGRHSQPSNAQLAAPNASLADAEAARERAWQKRGEI